jgi:dipeptidyl aminopeptidase/acylaminoacyl peptidase
MLTGSRRCFFLSALACSLAVAGPVTAEQLTAADYARAERFLFTNKDKYLPSGEVRHRWIEGQDRFWYRRTDAAGAMEFVLVDAATGKTTAAFDHTRVATGLAEVLGRPVAATALPFTSFRYAPAGKAIEFAVDDKFVSCQLDRDACENQALPPQLDRSVVVSPDGKWAAFLKDHNLWIRAVDGGGEFALTTDGVEHDGYAGSTGNNLQPVALQRSGKQPPPSIKWSPDSRKILTHRIDDRQVKDLYLLQSVPDDGAIRPKAFSYRYSMANDAHKPQVRQLVFDVMTRQRVDLDFPVLATPFMTPVEVHDAWWSDDSREVIYVERGPFYRTLTLRVANTSSGKSRTLVEESGKTFIELAAIGHRPAVKVLSNGNVLWFSERDGWGHLYLYDTSGRVRQITRGEWLVRGIVGVDERRGTVYFTASGRERGRNPYFRHLYRVQFDGSGLKLLTPEDAEHEIAMPGDPAFFLTSSDPMAREEQTFGLSPSGKYFIDIYSRPDSPATSVLRAIDGRLIATLEKADLSALGKDGFSMPEPFEVLAADGKTKLYGTVLKPSRFDAAKKYPVIDSIYPGPQITRVPRTFSATMFDTMGASSLAELGFIVVTVDGRGTPLRSKAFLDESYGKLGQAGNLDDHIAAFKQLAQRHSWMDLDRVGIFGQSGGGYASTRAMLTHPEFYKVAVSGAGNHDQRGYLPLWGETYNGPDDGKNYLESANSTLAKNLRGKLLLIHGDMDDNVHPSLTLQVVDALIKANKNFDMLIVPNANHGVMMQPYAQRRQWDYFVRHLLGAEPPADYQIGLPSGAGE